MSLINNMLKGLERRQTEQPNAEDYAVLEELSAVEVEELSAPHNRSRMQVWVTLSLILLPVILYISGIVSRNPGFWVEPEISHVNKSVKTSSYHNELIDADPGNRAFLGQKSPYWSRDGDPTFSLRLDSNLAVPASTSSDSFREADNTATISDIQLSQSQEEGTMSLNLNLDGETKYQVYTLKKPDRVVLELTNAGFEGFLPDVNDLPGINAIRQKHTDDGRYRLVIESDNEVLIESSTLGVQGDGYALSVNMESLPQSLLTPEAEIDEGRISRIGSFNKVRADDGSITPVKGISKASPKTDELIYEGRELYQGGKVKQGLEKIIEAVNKDPKHVRARSTLAVLLLEQGKGAMAKEVLAEGLSIKPDQAEWAKILGRTLYSDENLEQARVVLEEAAPPIRDDPDYHALYAAVLQSLGDHARSAVVYRNLLKYSGDKGAWWLGLAISLEAMARNSDAVIAYRNALKAPGIKPDSAEFIKSRLESLNRQS